MRYRIKVHERLLVVEDTELTRHRQSKDTPVTHESQKSTQNGGNKDIVQGLSARSRSRLIRFLATIGRTDDCYFVTLTYWRWNENWEEWKRDLDSFIKALGRFADGACGVWRLEFQERGAPHFHILCWFNDAPDVGAFRCFTRDAWLRIIDQDSPETRAHATTVDLVMDTRKSAFYISVYQSKDKNDRKDIHTGRLWGVFGRDRLQLEPVREEPFTDYQLLKLRRIVRRLYRATHRKTYRKSRYFWNLKYPNTTFSSFGDIPHWYRVLKYIQNGIHTV